MACINSPKVQTNRNATFDIRQHKVSDFAFPQPGIDLPWT